MAMNSGDLHQSKRPKYVENPTTPSFTLSEAFIAQQQHDSFEQLQNQNSYYNKQHAADKRECTLLLANKVISDLNTLVQYLESSDPLLLKESNLNAAQQLVTSFVMRVQSTQQPLPPNHVTLPTPVANLNSSQQHFKALSTPFIKSSAVEIRSPAVDVNVNNKAISVQEQQQQQIAAVVSSLPAGQTVGLSMFKPFEEYSPPPPFSPTPSVTFSSETRLEDFKLLTVLGTGTFGKVRLCQHLATEKYYCMKILNKARIVQLKQGIEHIKNEKDVLKSVSHPFIVKFFGTFKDKTSLYLLLEYIPGGELFNYIRKAGRLPNYIAKIYAAEIVLALEYLHSKDILYRDLKPENLLIDRFGHIKLTDFGFAKHVRERTRSMAGTQEYIAPEIILSTGHGKPVDWWSLGILIFEMLAGYPPFSDDEANQTAVFEKILTERAEIPEHFDPLARDLIEKLLVVDSSRRLGSLRGKVADIKNHPWFAEIDWVGLINRTLPGPLNPGVKKDNGDTHNFYSYGDVTFNQKLDENTDYETIFADF